MTQRALPRPGEFYRHFKNRLYQIVAVAYQADDEAPVVVYQALYGDFRVWVRPLEDFLSRIDRKKYPEASQEWRFERTVPEGPAQDVTVPEGPAQDVSAVEDSRTGTQVLLAFLDAETREEKKAALVSGMDRLTQRELDSIYMALDMPAQEGDVRTQVSGILSWMKTQERYESSRLRDGRTGIISRKV